MPSYQRELERVLELVTEAGELLRSEVTRPGGPRGAGDHADVDDEMCALLVDGLAASFPEDTIRSEELPERVGASGRAFVIDPHDGTRHFLRGSRDTSISIGLVEAGRLVLGVVYAPVPTELTGSAGLLVDWCAGGALRRDRRPLPLEPGPERLAPGQRVLASPDLRPELRRWNEERVAPAALVGCGSPATRCALTAVGEAAGWVTIGTPLHDWDYGGGQALLRAAGGALVGVDGQRIEWEGTRPAREGNRHFFGGRSLPLARELARRYAEGFEARAAARGRG